MATAVPAAASHTSMVAPAANDTVTATSPRLGAGPLAATYIVRAGDWLASIAQRSCGSAGAWPAIYAANRATIGANSDLIYPGQRLRLTCRAPQPVQRSVASAPAAGWANPLPGAAVTSCYGWRQLAGRSGAMHRGTDLAKPTGSPIHAAHAGVVRSSGWRFGGYGISVVIDHGNGVYTHYAHMSRSLVSVGERVKAGQTIGRVGATGDVTGPHLHFEVWRGWFAQVAPTPFMRAHGIRVGC